jgi:predicted permease
MHTIWQDVRHGIRLLAKNPGFTAVAVLSLALGIGANTTIFSFVNGLLFRPPSVSEPSRLLEVWQHRLDRGNGFGSHMQLAYPEYAYYRDHNQVFSSMAAFTGESSSVIWNHSGDGQAVQAALVSANFFSVLGVQPVLGRAFLPDDDQSSSTSQVAVISNSFWKQRLGADPAIVGKPINLNGRDFIVAGVAPPQFTGIFIGFSADLWTPLVQHPPTNPALDVNERHMHWLLGVGRLKPGVTQAQAKADFAILSRQLADAFPDPDKELDASLSSVELVPGPFRGLMGGISAGLMTVVGIVLLIACGNAANLLLAKSASRQREMAVRAALGAARGRLIQQTLTESVLLSSAAGVLGLLIAYWAAPLLLSLKPASLPVDLNVSLDVRVLVFTVIASILTGLVFGLAPALQGSKLDLVTNLKEGSPRGSATKSRLRNFLVVGQVTACVVLLIGAGLCVRSLFNARSIDPGFDTQNAMAASINVEPFGYSAAQGKIFYRDLVERVSSIPGVRAVAIADHLPLGQFVRMEGVDISGDEAQPQKTGDPGYIIDDAIVSPGYFESMGIPILRGRPFTSQDGETAPAVIVINQVMADRFWAHKDPVGQFVNVFGPNRARIPAQIVGVAKSGKYQMLGEEPKPFFYRCILQEYEPGVQIVVRTQGDAAALLSAVRHELQQIDSRLTLVGAETLQQHMQLPLFPAQAIGLFLGTFGFLALLLALVGLYGVIAYSVSQRTQEVGIRIALGAAPGDVLRLVIWQGLRLTLIGLSIGLVGALGATRILSSVLYGVSPSDPLSYLAVIILLLAVALLASYIPARRATRVDPIVALRYE